jgi:hypothetical protein
MHSQSVSKDIVIVILALVLVFVISTKRESPPITNIITHIQRDTVLDKSLQTQVDSLGVVVAKAKKENQRLTKQINTKLERYTPDTTLCDSLVADYQQLTDTLQHEITALEKRDSVQDSIIMLERFLFNEANTKLMEASDLLMETSESFEIYKKKQDTWWNRNQKYIYFGLGVATTYIVTK